MNGCILSFVASLVLSINAPDERKSFELTPEGSWQPIQMPEVPTTPLPDVKDPALDRVEELLRQENFAAARETVLSWLKANRGNPLYDRGLYYMADENWALAEKRARTHRLTPAYWFAMVVPFVLGWLINSTLGAVIGAVLGDPKRLGADFAFTALFIVSYVWVYVSIVRFRSPRWLKLKA